MGPPTSVKLSALTPENVPTPPVAAQAPELSPFDTEMPLPPSTSGNTSRPEMTSGLSGFTKALPDALLGPSPISRQGATRRPTPRQGSCGEHPRTRKQPPRRTAHVPVRHR